MTAESENTYGLVMPFIVVTSHGGPYDDVSFVAGCRYAAVAAALAEKPASYESYEYPALLPQLDLLAMHEGYVMETEPWDEHPEDWTLVRFTRIEDPTHSDGGADA